MKQIVYLFSLVLFLLLTGCGTKSRLATADKQFVAGEYASALKSYSRVYGRISYKDKDLKSRIAFNQAECLRSLNYTRSEMMYQRAIRYKYADSLVYLRYARALHRNGKYGDAAKNYKLYLEYDSASILAKNGLIAISDSIPFWKNHALSYNVKRENDLYARNQYTFSPAFAGPDKDVLYFTSTRGQKKKGKPENYVVNTNNNQIYFIKKDLSGKWSKPEPVFSSDVTDGVDMGTSEFTPDGKSMYFTRASQKEESDASSEIYFSSRAGGVWTEPQKVTFFKDSTISVGHPAIAPDGETFYFSSDAPDGFGGKDIWVGKLSGSECKFIENAGPQINTPGDEMFPAVRSDGTLYFSSDGLPGFGGLDIFKAVKTGEESWSVVNMGASVNSGFDDFGISFEGTQEKGFLSSNRGQIRGYDAIWNFELPETEIVVAGKVLDDKLNPIPDAMVRLISNTGQNTKVVSRKDGSYRIKIDKEMDCVMLGTARGFLNKTASVSSKGISSSHVFDINLVLPAAFRPVQIDNIFFEFAKWDITPESEAGLHDLEKILKDNPEIKIEISAHTDYIGNNRSNMDLSAKRAKSVVDYLIGAGVKPERLISAGYGEEKPFVVDEGTAAKYTFLPFDQALTEEFILTLTPEQQNIANQINRRTEFKVVKLNYR